ncbi:tigger transposable element-derived protein 1 [Trichonephila clavipes]|nr:tigger transposable element-derived protein 1 [Trichonephila clavipes]
MVREDTGAPDEGVTCAWKLANKEKIVKTGEIGNGIEELADLARKINLEVDSDNLQGLLDSHNQELKMDELIKIHQQERGIEELESLDPVQSDRVMVGNLTEGSLIEKGLHILENIDSSGECILQFLLY